MTESWRLFLDQNIRYEVKGELATEGIDILHAADAGIQRGLDPDILRYALSQNRVLVTLDSDFGDLNLFPLPDSHPGVIRLRIHPPLPIIITQKLLTFLKKHDPDSIHDALVIITKNRTRIRRRPEIK